MDACKEVGSSDECDKGVRLEDEKAVDVGGWRDDASADWQTEGAVNADW